VVPGAPVRTWLRFVALGAAGAAVSLLLSLGIRSALGNRTVPGEVVRHQNPATIAVQTDPAAVFERYRLAVSRFAAWRFKDGRVLLARLEQGHFPPEIRSLVSELSGLMIAEGDILEAADRLLREASALIEAGRADEARPLLAQLSRYARRGEILFDDAAQGFRDLGRRLNVEALPPDAPERQSFEQLKSIAARAGAMLLAYGAVARDPASVAAVARLIPYKTGLDLKVPAMVYPGRAFTISGRVIEQAPAPSTGRLLSLQLDDVTLAQVPPGLFRVEIVVPEGTLPGAHILTASIPTQGRHLGATAQRRIQVARAVPALRVDAPRSVLAPGQFVLSGTAASEFGPVPRAVVRVRVGRVVRETQTSERGEFRFGFEVPGALSLVGPQRLTVHLLPREPWHAPVDLALDLFVFNLVNAGLSAGLLLPAAGIAYARIRRRQAVAEPAEAAVADTDRSAFPIREEPADAGLPLTPKARLLSVYQETARLVRDATGLPIRLSATLREFARQVQPDLRGETFARMTGLAELALYSMGPITEDHLEEMRRLRAHLEGELAGATP
jgi:hypothetical protein